MMLGGEELWAYDVGLDTWTLYRTDLHPAYRLYSQAVFDSEDGVALLFGGEVYDVERRYLGELGDSWSYRHGVGGD